MVDFIHLHVHSQYSILDGACKLTGLIEKAIGDGMKGVAVTDHGNMFGIKEFHDEASKHPGFKPILGCETYVARRGRKDHSEQIDRKGDHLILLAKNYQGYQNLSRLISLAWVEGHYYKPRIDKELLREYHEGLIASSACLAGEIPRAILNGQTEKALAAIMEYKEIFGEDFYLELMRHPAQDPTRDTTVIQRQNLVNKALLELSQKTGVKLLATNDAHFLNEMDADAHDRLLCLNTGKDLDDPTRLRYTGQEWMKTRAEMQELFRDLPEALKNTMEVFEKIEFYPLDSKLIMPDFPVPEGYADEDDYLRFLTYEGAKKRYSVITSEIRERIEYELATIKATGYPGYFLIVQDFIRAAREMGVSVGPGRGSAAGSVVAYCTWITNIDPLKYDLLFERFLNNDRVSMPDIDIDFDEDGRNKVVQWVVEKYGKDKVAQVITFGTMGAKSAIKDISRVQKLPLSEAINLTKLVPDRPKITLRQAYKEVQELDDARRSENKNVAEILKFAEILEGSVRQTGIHACGVIIGKDRLIDHIPVTMLKDAQTALVTQYDGDHIEKVGMLKMDFLGLKTLAIIKDAVANIKKSKGVDLDMEAIPFDDKNTYQLFSQGKTTAIFQFESEGMRKYLKELKPNKIEDLIAMNALYRPGPMEYIPRYISRKFGREKIEYDHPAMEKFLKETYGITVYQEQVMQLSQELAGFSKLEADSLRKAMGKKKEDILRELQPKFFEGCNQKGITAEIAQKIWNDWASFAKYAFNKSHSTCYAYVAYRMAYLKAHYPAEFMAAVLSRNMGDIEKITNFIEECRRISIKVLGPDINESEAMFTVNKKGEIRFGMAGIKNVGENAVDSIIEERSKGGPYEDVFDFLTRVNLRSVNRRSLESLAKAGGFDSFQDIHRAQFFHKGNGEETTFLEKLLRYAGEIQVQASSRQHSLFGDQQETVLPRIEFPKCEPWSKMDQLKFEKEMIGFYMTGHPLDEFKPEILNFSTVSVGELKSEMGSFLGKEVVFAGMITEAEQRTGKTGKPFGSFTVEDYFDSIQVVLFSEEYLKVKHFLEPGRFVHIKARIEQRFKTADQYNLRINSVTLLQEVFEKFARSITLSVSLHDLNKTTISLVQSLVRKHKGKHFLKVQVVDEEEKLIVDLPSKKFRVDGKELLNALKDSQEFRVRVS